MLRKIETPEVIQARQDKRNKILVGLLLLLLVGSTAGYSFLSSDSGQSSTNEGIQNVGNQWAANFNGNQLYFSSSPDSINKTEINMFATIQDFYQKDVYISSNDSAISYEIASTLGSYAGRFQEACYGACNEDFPEKNCTDYLIVWNPSNENKVYQTDKCVFIEGDINAVDAFLYRLFGLA